MKKKTKTIKPIGGYIIVTEDIGFLVNLDFMFYGKRKGANYIKDQINSFPHNTTKVKVQKAEIIIK